MTTIHDVARAAGVSPATVSRVLNGTAAVAPALADRVHEAVGRLQYRPNRAARGLRSGRTAVWSLIVADIRNPFFTEVARGVEDAARDQEILVVLCNSDEDPVRQQRYLELALDEHMAGVIVSPTDTSPDSIRPLVDAGTAVVTIDRRVDFAGVDSVLVDNVGAARGAVEHLIASGYERIACISGPESTATGHDRAAGYREALAAAGREVTPEWWLHSTFSMADAARQTRALLDLEHPPDALFVANNLMTLGALGVVRERDLDVPDSFGLVGFDDVSWASIGPSMVSTVDQPAYDIGRRAAELLFRRRDEPDAAAIHDVLEAQLMVRQTSRRSIGRQRM